MADPPRYTDSNPGTGDDTVSASASARSSRTSSKAPMRWSMRAI